MKYELIIFDADETLFDFKKSERVSLEKTMNDFNLDYDEEYHLKTYKELNKAIWKDLEEGKITQKGLNLERFRRYIYQCDLKVDATLFANSYQHHLANASFLYPGSIELIERLSQNYRLMIITNGLREVQNIRIKKSEISPYFEEITVSEEVRVAKPDPKIFEIALDKILFFDKSKVLMVGDSLSSDIQGGINFGIDTCWYNPNQLDNPTSLLPTYVVKDYNELINLLK